MRRLLGGAPASVKRNLSVHRVLSPLFGDTNLLSIQFAMFIDSAPIGEPVQTGQAFFVPLSAP